MTVYTIAESNLPHAKKRIEQLNKVAKKLGTDPVVMEITGEEFVPDPFNPKSMVRMLQVAITATVPKLNGWEFVAVLQHEEAANIIRTVPGSEIDLSQYRQAPTWCDHCKINRLRKDTYIVRHETGELKQVGSNCLKDFTGHASAYVIMGYLEMLGTLEHFWQSGPGGMSSEEYYPTLDMLVTTAAVVRVEGWVSRAKSEETGKTPTSWYVRSILWPQNSFDIEIAKECVPNDDDTKLSNDILDWISQLTPNPDEDYLHNLKVAVDCEYTNVRNLGIVCSAIAAYRRVHPIEKASTKSSQWVGAIGDKYESVLALTKHQVISSAFGGYSTVLYIFEDDDGNVIKTFYSGNNRPEGTSVHVRGTIKNHTGYRGKKETILTRCRFN